MMKNYKIILLTLMTTVNLLFAQDGTLDTSFGSNGYLTLDDLTGDAQLTDLIKSGDYLYGAGYTTVDDDKAITVFKFNLDGTLVTSFGTNGIATFPLGSGDGQGTSILEQGANFLIGGYARYGNKEQYVVLRITEDGMLDMTFATDGIATGSFSVSSYAEDEIEEMRILSDGRIVVGGRTYGGSSPSGFVGCFNADGSLDNDFGNGGYQFVDYPDEPEQGTTIGVDGSDNIFIGGTISAESFSDEDGMFVVKMNDMGVIDDNFGVDGWFIHFIDSDVIAGLNDLEVDSQGRIVVAGGAFDTDWLDNDFFVARLLPNGTFDTSFGQSGITIVERGSNESVFDVEILPSGDILAAGSTGGFASRFAMVRFSPSGVKDLYFGTSNGWALTQIESNFNGIQAVAIDDGAIYAAGFGDDGDDRKAALAKYINVSSTGLDSDLAALNMTVYPNPTTSRQLFLGFELDETVDCVVQLYDLNGRLIEATNYNQLSAGSHLLEMNFQDNVISNLYVLKIQLADRVLTQKVEFR